MANWCSNFVTFTGGDIEGLNELMYTGQRWCDDKNEGWLPSFDLDGYDRYLFNIEVQDSGEIRFETKWAPPIQEMFKIAVRFGCSMEISYEELGNYVYGKATFDGNTLEDFCLTDDDFEQVSEREDGMYMYKGEVWESQYDIYEEILKHKLK